MKRERVILAQKTADRDRRNGAIAQGKTIAAQADDSNTLPFINFNTDEGNAKVSKLDRLKTRE